MLLKCLGLLTWTIGVLVFFVFLAKSATEEKAASFYIGLAFGAAGGALAQGALFFGVGQALSRLHQIHKHLGATNEPIEYAQDSGDPAEAAWKKEARATGKPGWMTAAGESAVKPPPPPAEMRKSLGE